VFVGKLALTNPIHHFHLLQRTLPQGHLLFFDPYNFWRFTRTQRDNSKGLGKLYEEEPLGLWSIGEGPASSGTRRRERCETRGENGKKPGETTIVHGSM
jgi:hypothetical protein